MATERHYSPLDRLLLQADTAMRTLLPFSGQPARPSPAIVQPDADLDDQQTRHIAADAYQPHRRGVCPGAVPGPGADRQTAPGTQGHGACCRGRSGPPGLVRTAHSPAEQPPKRAQPPVLWHVVRHRRTRRPGQRQGQPGFVAATEHQVCKHLDEHLEQIPHEDEKSRAILEQMRIDEEQHAESALEAGGYRFPAPVRFGMSLLAKVMTKSTYRI